MSTTIFASNRGVKQDGFYHSYKRSLAKAEANEAFQMRRKVIAVMCIASAFALIVAGWVFFETLAVLVRRNMEFEM